MIRAIVVAATICGATAAYADEVIVQHDHMDSAPVAESKSVTVHHDGDCASTTVHKTNDMGDSKTIKTTNCN